VVSRNRFFALGLVDQSRGNVDRGINVGEQGGPQIRGDRLCARNENKSGPRKVVRRYSSSGPAWTTLPHL
jgi:hypothetical protein